ncbi:MAG: hypothetical protein QM719_01985 [Thermomonas sp.]
MFPGIGLLELPPGGLQKLFCDFGGGDGGVGTGRAKAAAQANIVESARANFTCRDFMAMTVRGMGEPHSGRS